MFAASSKEPSGSNACLSGPILCQGKRYQGMTSGKGSKTSGQLCWLSSISLDNYRPHFSSEVGGKLTPCSSSRGTNVGCRLTIQEHPEAPILASMIGSGWAHDPSQPVITLSETIPGITRSEAGVG